MSDVMCPDLSDFCVPQSQSREVLELSIPMYMASLQSWLRQSRTFEPKPNQVTSFVYYLDTAFARARDLGLMAMKNFQDLYDKYRILRTPASVFVKPQLEMTYEK